MSNSLNRIQLQKQYDEIKAKKLNLDMSRGKPGSDVLDFSGGLLGLPGENYLTANGLDCRNYIAADGIDEIKELLSPMLGVSANNVVIGGNSSLQMMYDAVVRAMVLGVSDDSPPWERGKIKFLCPVPGYDRHFSICESLGIEMINVPLNENGPDMDLVEELASNNESVKGMWCVPIYSNPNGITYSDEVVRRLAKMPAKAKDFRLFWDCAYIIHHLNNTPDILLNISDECERSGEPDRTYMFASTSKVTFPGAGVALMAASSANVAFVKKHMGFQTIGGDKLNQLRHVHFFKNFDGIAKHMKTLQRVLKPKFDAVFEVLERELAPYELGKWYKPNGGYFISFDGNPGTAKKTVRLCREAGVVLTDAGATFPYKKDPDDMNIRIAPTFPPLEELREAMEVFCVSVKLANV